MKSYRQRPPTGLLQKRTLRADEGSRQGALIPVPRSRRGVLLCEAVFQTGALYLARQAAGQGTPAGVPLMAKISDVRFRNPVYPGETIIIEVKKKELLGGFTMMSGSIKSAGKTRADRRLYRRLDHARGAPKALATSQSHRENVSAWRTGRAWHGSSRNPWKSRGRRRREQRICSEMRRQSLATLLAGKPVFLCDVEQEGAAARLASE